MLAHEIYTSMNVDDETEMTLCKEKYTRTTSMLNILSQSFSNVEMGIRKQWFPVVSIVSLCVPGKWTGQKHARFLSMEWDVQWKQ